MSNCTVEFWADKDEGGYNKTYTDPVSKSNLSTETWEGHDHHHMDDTIGSVRTGSQAWVLLYSQSNYSGRSVLVGPNTTVNTEDLSSEGKDMDDTIESFILYDTKPDVNPGNIVNNFLDLYPFSDHSQYTVDNLWNSQFFSQNSLYRAYDPEIVVDQRTISVVLKFDHEITDNEDDHATLTFSMDLKGNFTDEIQVNYRMAKATHIPKWAIKIADIEVNLLADVVASILEGVDIVVTDGAGIFGEAELDEIVELVANAVTFCIDHSNALFKFMFVIQDDGGTMNFPAVVSHGIARIIYATYQEIFGHNPSSANSFDQTTFIQVLGGDSGDRFKDSANTNFLFNAYNYRAYIPDVSYFYGSGGALISLKIDANTDGEKDDHVIVQMTFDPQGQLYSILGTVDLFLDDYEDGYLAPTSGLIVLTVDGNLKQILKDQHGNTTYALLDYDSIEDAYADLIQTSIDSTARNYGFTLTDQQECLIGASLSVINAVKAGIKRAD